MTKDDIVMALRLTAMGRANHPLQEQLVDELVRVFAKECKCAEQLGDGTEPAPKRGPGRPKKAE